MGGRDRGRFVLASSKYDAKRSKLSRAGSSHLLEAAGEEAGHALEGPGDGDHLLAEVVQDVDAEGPQGPAALPVQTVVLLHGVEHVLAHGVPHLVLVVAFKADEG